jgi:uncharacterized protein (TIGR01777 family)
MNRGPENRVRARTETSKEPGMKILITGSSGLIGKALCSHLEQNHHTIVHMVRRNPVSENQAYWNPSEGSLDRGAFEGVDAVVHLAGESITGGRWTPEKKRRIRNSRILGTRLLSASMASLPAPPKVLISTSAVGYYGDRKDEVLDEDSRAGSGFLADVCRDWERETDPAAEKGSRVVILRFGIVLSRSGGALSRMLPVFRMGMGGRIGNGRQFMSWIAVDDLIRVIEYSLQDESLRGPVNAVAPNPATNRAFTQALGKALSRPARLTLPRFAARIIFGEMADALLLASARVVPARLMEKEFPFRFGTLEEALFHTFKNS